MDHPNFKIIIQIVFMVLCSTAPEGACQPLGYYGGQLSTLTLPRQVASSNLKRKQQKLQEIQKDYFQSEKVGINSNEVIPAMLHKNIIKIFNKLKTTSEVPYSFHTTDENNNFTTSSDIETTTDLNTEYSSSTIDSYVSIDKKQIHSYLEPTETFQNQFTIDSDKKIEDSSTPPYIEHNCQDKDFLAFGESLVTWANAFSAQMKEIWKGLTELPTNLQ